MSKVAVKKTGYADIDNLLVNTHTLLKRGELLKKDIEISLRHKPVNPFTSRKAHLKNFKRFRSTLNNN
ncbi:hypothetical protein ACTHO0_25475 [Cytobacillus praedii]|uniref:hypothetical protein n=1 Tax=Cytobacillus praedii TaxID=1742358 RepID=UPI003F8209D1